MMTAKQPAAEPRLPGKLPAKLLALTTLSKGDLEGDTECYRLIEWERVFECDA